MTSRGTITARNVPRYSKVCQRPLLASQRGNAGQRKACEKVVSTPLVQMNPTRAPLVLSIKEFCAKGVQFCYRKTLSGSHLSLSG